MKKLVFPFIGSGGNELKVFVWTEDDPKYRPKTIKLTNKPYQNTYFAVLPISEKHIFLVGGGQA
jgi:hypothetical protein